MFFRREFRAFESEMWGYLCWRNRALSHKIYGSFDQNIGLFMSEIQVSFVVRTVSLGPVLSSFYVVCALIHVLLRR